jgi:hypothetical protein
MTEHATRHVDDLSPLRRIGDDPEVTNYVVDLLIGEFVLPGWHVL